MKLNWTSRCVFTRKSFALLLLLFVGNLTVLAQAGSKAVKVTISPKSGNIISVRSASDLEAGSEAGYGSPTAEAKMLNAINISFDEWENQSLTNGIQVVDEQPTLAVTTIGNNIIAISKQDTSLRIYNMSGQVIANTIIKAGESRIFRVSTGIYLVNGKKITVK